jgi:hypothetical protein
MGVVSNSDVSMENIVDTTYTDLNTLLDEHSEVNIPQYLVDNCTFDSATCHLDSTKKEYSIFLANNGNMIRFKQTLYFDEGSLPSINYEVDGDIVEQYSSNNFDYYIYSNNDRLIAIWGVDDTRYHIIGNFSVDELERVIDSIC